MNIEKGLMIYFPLFSCFPDRKQYETRSTLFTLFISNFRIEFCKTTVHRLFSQLLFLMHASQVISPNRSEKLD